jgi:hypothetical protein
MTINDSEKRKPTLLEDSEKTRLATLKAAAHDKKPLQQFKKFVGKAVKGVKNVVTGKGKQNKGPGAGLGM